MDSFNPSKVTRGTTWQQFGRHRDKSRRDQLTEAYLPLVQGVATKMCRHLGGNLDVDDLASVGTLGLMKAIESYDPNRSTTFEAYAYPRIRGAMLDYVRSCDWVSRTVRRRSGRRANALAAFQAAWGRKPSEQELAEEIGVAGEESQKVMAQRIPTMMSLDQSEKSSDQGQGFHIITLLRNGQEPDPADSATRKDLKEFLLRNLNQKERQLVLLYYYENLSMKEIGAVMGLSESRVSQTHTALCHRLRQQFATQASDLRD